VTLIGVKSKYGSGWGTSPGIININNTQKSLCKEHKIFIWFESINRLIINLYFFSSSFNLKCSIYNTKVIAFKFQLWVLLVRYLKVRVLELVDRTSLSFVDVMS